MNNSNQTGMGYAYPKVLMITWSAFGDHSATSVTLTNLFTGWMKERLALLHFDMLSPKPDGGICRQTWWFSNAEVPMVRIFARIRDAQRKYSKTSVAKCKLAAAGELPIKIYPAKEKLRRVVSSWSDLFPIQPPREFWKFLEVFQPEVIYSTLASARIMELALRISARTGAPIVPHIMDDFIGTYYHGWGQNIPRFVLHKRFRNIAAQAPVGMTIGTAMAVEYTRRYGGRWEAFMNCVEVPADYPALPAHSENEPVKLLFIGGLHLNRWRMVVEIGAVLQALRAQGLAAKFEVQAPEGDLKKYASELAGCPATDFRPLASANQLFASARAADVLVHLDSFDQATRQYLRYSVSTKIPLYMASGRPILVYGPGEVGTSRHVGDSGSGLVVGESNPDQLKQALHALVSSADLRGELGRRAWATAHECHEVGRTRKRFCETMAQAARQERTDGYPLP